MFPEDFIENNSTDTETEVGIDFVFDYETGQHTVKNGVLQECSTLQSIQQYIQNVLRTQANSYDVYIQDETDVFGISVYDYIGHKGTPMGYINSELKREVTENLLKHPYISSVTEWVGAREKRGLNISFTVTLTDGSIITENATVNSQAVI